MLPGLAALSILSLILLALLARSARRRRRLARALEAPLSDEARRTLLEHVAYYRRLDAPERARFEREVRRFLFDQVITGPRERPLPDELRTLVAASAVILVFGHRGFVYPRTRDIVVYDEAFDDDYRESKDGPIAGMVHGAGPILFSARQLREGFDRPSDGFNPGLHEFAHVLDFDRGRADGLPCFVPHRLVRPWVDQIHQGIARVEAHRSILRAYAATNEAEFFAVATEAFFERPKELSRAHPTLYALLEDAYGQHPAKDG